MNEFMNNGFIKISSFTPEKMELNLFHCLALLITGLGVGFINTLAGSGSLITLPLLIFLGMDAGVANGTNRIAILLQTLVGLLTFKKEKILDTKISFRLAIPAIAGAVPGAILATIIPDVYFEKVLGIIFIIMTCVIIITPGKWNKSFLNNNYYTIKPVYYLIFFLIGIYGGFIQAGVGIFMLFALVSGIGIDVVRANAIKLFLTFVFTPLTLIIFWQQNQIDWNAGLILAAGNMAGAFIAAKTAIRTGAKFIKWLVVAMILFSAILFIFFR